MYTLTGYMNGKLKFCWALDTKDKAVMEGVRWLRRGGGAVEVCKGDHVIWFRSLR